MTKIDILNYYRKLIEKSRSFCAEHINVKELIAKVKSFCAAHLNIRRIDAFLIITVVAALGYIVVNHSCKVVNEPERVTIVISSQCVNLFGKDTVNALIQEFEKLNPELRIQEAGVDDSVDIVFFDDSEFGGLMKVTALVSFMDIFVYNIDILKAANLDRPPKTRAEFLTAARAVEALEDDEAEETNQAPGPPVFAFALGLNPADPLALRRDFYPWIWANGVDIHSIDLSGDNPALPRTVMDVVALFGQLNREGLLAPETFEKTGTQRLQEFAEGKIAMMIISARDIAYLLNSADGITFGITALPAMTQGKNRLGLSSIYAGISSASAIPDEARIFLSFLAKKSDVLAEALGAVPGSYPGGFAGEYIEKNELYSKAWDIFEAADIVEYKPGQPSEEAFNHLVREKLVEAFE